MRHSVIGIVFASIVVAACGSGFTSEFTEDAGTGTPSDDASSGGPPIFGGDSSPGPTDCASKVLCGPNATCCGQGQECVEAACVAACASGVRCGTTCCPGGQVCLSQTCVAPGIACQDSFDCAENEFCEPTLSKCLPQPQGAAQCTYKPSSLIASFTCFLRQPPPGGEGVELLEAAG